MANRSATFQNTRFKLAELRTEIDFSRAYLDRCMELQFEDKLGIDAAAAAKYKISQRYLSKVVNRLFCCNYMAAMAI